MTRDIDTLFDEKLKEMEKRFLEGEEPKNGAAWTFTSILDVLGLKDPYYNNLALAITGQFGGYKSKEGYKATCGAVVGGCAAIGVILGGKKEINRTAQKLKIYDRTRVFVHNFEKKFGSILCQTLTGTDYTDLKEVAKHLTNKVWENKCHKYVLWAINEVRNLTAKELKKYWI